MGFFANPSTRTRCMLLATCFVTACNLTSQSQAIPSETSATEVQTALSTQQKNSSPIAPPTATTSENITQTTVDAPPASTLPASTSTPTSLPSLTSPTPTDMTIKVFLIAMEDHGQSGTPVGCGDSAMSIIRHVPYSPGVLRAALTSLLSIHEQYYGESGLYNALYQSHLTVGDITITSGTAFIHLSGTLLLGGECDSPRVDAQLKQTAMQFSTVHSASIFINDRPLADLLSGR
jgi:hypothetical protein